MLSGAFQSRTGVFKDTSSKEVNLPQRGLLATSVGKIVPHHLRNRFSRVLTSLLVHGLVGEVVQLDKCWEVHVDIRSFRDP